MPGPMNVISTMDLGPLSSAVGVGVAVMVASLSSVVCFV